MTEYEAYDIIMSIASQTYSLMFGYFSLVFGFIVMSHLAANKLSGRLVAVVIGLYTLASVVIVLNFYALKVDLDSLYVFMLDQKEVHWADSLHRSIVRGVPGMPKLPLRRGVTRIESAGRSATISC